MSRSCAALLTLLELLLVSPVSVACASYRAAPPVVADFESVPQGALARLGTTRWRPTGWSEAVCFDPAGRLLASGEIEGIGFWELASGRLVRQAHFPGSRSCVPLQFRSDGK